MNYREIRPAPHLARFIECFWVLEGSGGGPQRIFPDGCTEIILNFGDPFTRLHDDGARQRQPRSFLVGQIPRSIVVEPSASAGVFGIRFRPVGAAALLRVPQHELAGRMLSLDLLLKRDFPEPILNAATDAGRVQAAERLLASRLSAPPDAMVEAAVNWILSSHGQVSINQLAARLGSPRRRLERRFLSHVGLSPKRLARIARFHRALQVIERRNGNWVASALDAGYYDQAHFIREFKEFTGLTPAAYFPAQQPLSDYFARKNRPDG